MSDFDDDLPRRRSGGLFRRRGRRPEPALLDAGDEVYRGSEDAEVGVGWDDFAPDTWARDAEDEPVEATSRRRSGRRRGGRTADMFSDESEEGRLWAAGIGKRRAPASAEVDAWLQSDAEQFADLRRTSAERWVDPQYIDDVTGPISTTQISAESSPSATRRRTISSHVTVTPAYLPDEAGRNDTAAHELITHPSAGAAVFAGAEDWPDMPDDGEDETAVVIHDDEPTTFGDSLVFGDPIDTADAIDPTSKSLPGATWPDDDDDSGQNDVAATALPQSTTPTATETPAPEGGYEPRRAAILRDEDRPNMTMFEPPAFTEIAEPPAEPLAERFEPPPAADSADIGEPIDEDDPWAFEDGPSTVRVVPAGPDSPIVDARVLDDVDEGEPGELDEGGDADDDDWDAPTSSGSRRRRGWRGGRRRGKRDPANEEDEELWPDPDAPVENDAAWDAPDLTAALPSTSDESWGDDDDVPEEPTRTGREQSASGSPVDGRPGGPGEYATAAYEEATSGYQDGYDEYEGGYNDDSSPSFAGAAVVSNWAGVASVGGVMLALVGAGSQVLAVGYGVARPEGTGRLRQDVLQRLGAAFDGIGPFPALLFVLAAVMVSLPIVTSSGNQRRLEGRAGTTLGLSILGSIIAIAGSYLAFRADINAVDQLGGGIAGWQLMRSGANLTLAAGVGLIGFAVGLLSLRNRSEHR